jgi:RNA-binding protein
VGTDGVSDAFLANLEDAFNTRELLKVKVQEGAPVDARTAADEITARVEGVQVPQVIGRTVVLYRPDPEAPEIRLP